MLSGIGCITLSMYNPYPFLLHMFKLYLERECFLLHIISESMRGLTCNPRKRREEKRAAVCLLGSQTASLGFHALTGNVDEYGEDDNQTEYDVLDRRGSSHQGEAVTQGADDQRAEHGAEHGALAAHEGSAADDARRDRVGIERLDRVCTVGDGGTADRDQAGQRCAETGNRVAEGQYVIRVDTGQTGSFQVSAYTVDRAAQRGAGQEDVHDDVQNDNEQEAYRDAAAQRGEHTLRAQPHNAFREAGNHLRTGYQQRHAPEEVLHTQRRYEGVGQVQTGEEHAVDPANERAGHDYEDDHQERVFRTALYQHTGYTGCERCVRANRQVDTGGDQAQQHADRQNRVERGLAQYVHQVVRLNELAAAHYRDHDAEQHPGDQYAKLIKFTLILCLSHLKYLPMQPS